MLVRYPWRWRQIPMQASPKAARTTPPSGREPVATATAKPPSRPAAASGAVGRRQIIEGMLAVRSMVGSVEEGLPVAYQVLEDGVAVYASDGMQVGTVDHVVAAPEEDIFHGLVIRTEAGSRFVAADQVAALHERGADLRIASDQVSELAEPHGAAPARRVREPGVKPSRWREILDTVSGADRHRSEWNEED